MANKEEKETSEELEALQRVQKDIESHTARFRALKAKGKLSALLEDEIVSTILPLMGDLAKAQVAQVEMFEEWAAEVEDALEEGGGGSRPDLADEEIEIFGWLFRRLGEFVGAAKENPDLPSATTKALLEVEVKLDIAVKILSRLEEREDGEEAGLEADEESDERGSGGESRRH